MVAIYIKKNMHNVNCATLVCSKMVMYMFLVGQVSRLVENFNIGIFSDAINLLYTCITFQWPWHYFEVTLLWNSFNWKCYVLIWLSWYFVGLLSTSIMSWIYHYFWLLHIYKGDNSHVSWLYKNFIIGKQGVCFFVCFCVCVFFFLLFSVITLLRVYQFMCQNHKLQILFQNFVYYSLIFVWFLHTLKGLGSILFVWLVCI